jgi:hypothetical protein
LQKGLHIFAGIVDYPIAFGTARKAWWGGPLVQANHQPNVRAVGPIFRRRRILQAGVQHVIYCMEIT